LPARCAWRLTLVHSDGQPAFYSVTAAEEEGAALARFAMHEGITARDVVFDMACEILQRRRSASRRERRGD
jgi:hypothetical protein